MARRDIKINLLFDAQTTAAQRNIEQLGQLLNQISSKTVVGVDSGSLQSAVTAAQQLQVHLQNAVNVDTGKLDLMRLNTNLKSSGKTLQEYASSLMAVGPQGEQAFLRLASAVSSAQVPMVKTNKVLKDFMVTLANTAKWQIASSAIHGIQGMLSSAVSYAKDLNQALVDVQIVTNYSTNAMANFAESAAKAARELNTTTTEYAKAALIFYQQGLSGSAAEERAAAVVKLSQITGQSAKVVSDQMTAIWNNFDDGKKSLEYFADALTKLGAATAASTDEIAAGLEKFAAVAETIGLSYEYAAAAVATIIDKTRQSADVVGTSLKTIFARMQGLSLGETLDDGVTLNKYSEALEKVGVNILTADGELKEMDKILDALGSKWEGLGEETKVALAQTVGGVRQYNQLMSLMNNWEDVKDNIDLAAKSTGTLAQQQKIWSASYEASLNKLNQAKNDLYQDFIKDDTLIAFNDVLTQVIKGFDKFIDVLGGIGPTALILTGIFGKTLFPLIGNGIRKLGNTISIWTGKAAKEVAAMQNQMSQSMSQLIDNGNLTKGMEKQILLSQQLLQAKQRLMLNSKHMTEAQRMEAESRLAVAESMAAEASELLQRQNVLERGVKADKNAIFNDKSSMMDVAKTKVALDAAGTSDAEVQNTVDMATSFTNTELIAEQEQGAERLRQLEEKRADLAKKINERAQDDGWKTRYQKQLEATEQQIEREQEYIKTVEDAIEVQQKYTSVARTGQINENTVVGKTRGVEAGGILEHTEMAGTESNRVAEDDSQLLPDLYANQNAQMQNAASALGTEFSDGGALQIEASIANYEKLFDVIAEQNVMHSKLATAVKDADNAFGQLSTSSKEVENASKKVNKEDKALIDTIVKNGKSIKDLTKEEKNAIKSNKEYYKALSDQKKMQDNAVDSVKKSENAYMDLAQSAGATENQTMELEKAFKQLNGSTVEQQAGLKTISAVFAELGIASDGVRGDLDLVALEMRELLLAAGFPAPAIDALTQKLREMANQAPLTRGALEGTGKSLQGLTLNSQDVTKSLTSGATTVMSLIGSFQMLQSSITGLTEAWSEDGTASEKAWAILSTIMAGLPLVITLTELLGKVKVSETLATLKSIPAKLAERAGTIAETAAKWGLTTANLAVLATNPFTIALVAVALGVIAATVIAINKQKKATDDLAGGYGELTEAQRDNAQSATDNAKEHAKLIDTWIDEMNAMDALIKKYKELADAEEDSADSAKDILESVPDLIDAYDKLAKSSSLSDSQQTLYNNYKAQLEAATEVGDVETVEKITSDIDRLFSGINADSLQGGIERTMAGLVSDIFTDADVKVTSAQAGNSTFANGASGVFIEDLDDDSVLFSNSSTSALTNAANVSWGGSAVDGVTETGWYGFGVRTDSTEHFLEDYERLLELYNTAQRNIDAAALADDDGFQALRRIIEATESSYNDLIALQETQTNAKITETALGVGDIDDIQNYSEYLDYVNKIREQLKDTDITDEEINTYFAKSGVTKNYVAMDRRLSYLKDEGMSTPDIEAIRGYIQGLSEEDQKLFLNVDLNKYQTKEAIIHALEMAQFEADKKPIIAKLDAIIEVSDSLKENDMTSADWEKIRTSLNWGEEGLINFSEFLGMSYKDQSNYLEKTKLEQQQLLTAVEAQKLAQTQANLEIQKQLLLEEESRQVGLNQLAQRHIEIDLIEEEMAAQEEALRIQLAILEDMKLQELGLNPAEVDEYAEHLMEMSYASDLLAESLLVDEAAAKKVAVSSMRLNRGVESLSEGFSEWQDVLMNSDESSQEYFDSLTNLRTAMSDLLNVDEEFLSSSFLTNEDNLKLMQQAAEGNAEAIDELARKAAKDIVWQVTMKNGLTSEETANVISKFEAMQALFDSQDLKIGASFDNESFIAAAQELISTANLTVDEANAIFSSMGYSAVFKTEEKPVLQKVPITRHVRTITDWDQNGNPIEWTESTYQDGETEFEGMMTVPAMTTSADGTTEVPVIESISKTSTGSLANSSSVNAGGNTSSSKKKSKVSRKSQDDILPRYKETEDRIDDVSQALDKANAEMDKLYGANRLKQMSSVNKLLKDEIKLLERKAEENKLWLERDSFNLNTALNNSKFNTEGLEFIFDENHNITNYTSVMQSFSAKLNAMYNTADSISNEGERDRYIANVLEPYEEWIDEVLRLIGVYEDTVQVGEETANSIADYWNEWQSNNAEALNLQLELNLSINERDLERLEYELEKISDDAFSMAEALGLIVGRFEDGLLAEDGQLQAYLSNLEAYQDQFGWASHLHETIDPESGMTYLSDADYYKKLAEISSGIYENLDALNELDKTMLAYYNDTLAAFGEEIDKITEKMENQSAVLDHYNSLMAAFGKETDYKTIGVILEGQAQLLEDQTAAAKATLDAYKNEVNITYDRWQQALLAEDAAAAELYEKEYEAALQAASEAEDAYLSKATEWAEVLKAVLENTLADLNKTLETALTGGTTFDSLNQSMERAKSLQEEYLTATNKVYETNKLMRTAQQKIDKTTNTAAKKRLQAYIKETQQLQNQSKLSQYELNIQQAKYDLLLAEIALEDAQAAKSTVRLQRDSEGNFGYVYTADANAIAEAEQKLIDAQNNLYNIGLQGANDYAEKYQQQLQEMYDDFRDIQQQALEGAFASEAEYNAAMEEAKRYHYEKLAQYSELYQIALTTDSNVTADAWANDSRWMINQSENWKTDVTNYVGQVQKAFEDWDSKIATLKKTTLGNNLNDLKDKVGDIVDESDKLLKKLTDKNGLLDAMGAEAEAVLTLTSRYGSLRTELQGAKSDYESFLTLLQQQQDAGSGKGETVTKYSFLNAQGQWEGTYDSAQAAAQAAWDLYGNDSLKIGTVDVTTNSDGSYSTAYQQIKDASQDEVKDYDIKKENETIIPPGPNPEDFAPPPDKGSGNTEQTGSPPIIYDDDGSQGVVNEGEEKNPPRLTYNTSTFKRPGHYGTGTLTFGYKGLQEAINQGRFGQGYGSYYVMQEELRHDLSDAEVKKAIKLYKDVYNINIAGYKDPLVNSQSPPAENPGPEVPTGPQKYTDAELNAAKGKYVTVASNETKYGYYSDGERSNSLQMFTTRSVHSVKDVKRSFFDKGGAYKLGTRDGDLWFLASDFTGPLDASKFDTGGYTGSWGSYGKLAILHEKELVLNKQQTQDLLLSMEVLERILQAIDLQSISSQIGGILSTPGFSNPGNSILEQNVHIEASFPNATNHSEIEEAFGNLVNLASQYANRK